LLRNFGWIRDALGIRKDMAGTKKVKLEIFSVPPAAKAAKPAKAGGFVK
jgi:hypothetical protein